MSSRNNKGQYQKGGFNSLHIGIISFAAILGMAVFFSSYSTDRLNEWKDNIRMNAQYQTQTPLSMTHAQIIQLQNKNSALR